MNKILNILTFFFGLLTVFAGISKILGRLDSFELHIGEYYLKIPFMTSLIYNFIVNIFGGFSMMYHAGMTMNYKKKIVENIDMANEDILDSKIKRLSNSVYASGLLTIGFSAWISLKTMVIFSFYEGSIIDILPLLIFSILVYGTFAIIPIVLVSQNIALNNKIGELLRDMNR